MKKKIFTLLTLLVAVCSGAWAASTATEIIKITLTGQTTFTMSGYIGGTGAVSGLGSSSPYKISGNSTYVAITLEKGYFQAGDIVKIDGSKAMQLFTGTAGSSGTLIGTTGAPSAGVISYTLPNTLPDQTSSICIGRTSSTYNGTLTYMSVTRNIYDNQPNIYAHPLSADYSKDEAATELSVVAGATSGDLSYQWKSCTDAEKTGAANIIGETNSTYTPSTATAGKYYYYCTVTDGNGSTDTNVATINVVAVAPSITTNIPSTKEVLVGVSTEFNIVALYASTYQWYTCDDAEKKNPVVIDGATSDSYTYTTAEAGTKYIYCVVSNTSGDATSTVCAITAYNSAIIYSMSAATAPTDALAAGAGSDLTATFVGGSGYVYNGHSDNTAQMVYGGNVNLAGSGASYFKATLDKAIQEGDVITVYSASGTKDETADAFYVSTSTTKGSTKYTFPYTVTSTSVLKDATNLYFWKNKSDQMYSVTVSRKAVEVPINAYGWATFSDATNILDFANATPAGLTAYKITGHESTTVTKTAITAPVAAGTGLLLNGTANTTYYVPIAATATADVSGNLLVAGTGVAISAVEGKTRYVLGVSASSAAEFQKIVSVAATVPVGKAYLQFNEVISARNLTFDENETTGINEELRMKNEESVFFDLQGRRVAQPTKGLYIVNGKKVIVK